MVDRAVTPAPFSDHSLKRLGTNALANLVRVGAAFLIMVASPPLLVHSLDRSTYATWMLVLQVAAYATLLDGGLQLAVARYVARAKHEDNPFFLTEMLSSAFALLTGIAALVFFALALTALNLGRFFSAIPPSDLPQARVALLLISGSLSLAFPFSVLAGLYLGLERNKVNAMAGAVSKSLGAAGSVWAAYRHQGLIAMSAWIAAGALLQPVIFLVVSRDLHLRTLFRIRSMRLQPVADFARFCAAMTAAQLGTLLISGLDLPIVAAFDFHNAGYYAVGSAIASMMMVPVNTVLSALVPTVSSLSAQRESQRLGRLLVRTTRLSTGVLASVAAVLLLGMPTLLSLWVGRDYMEQTVRFADVLVIAQVVRLSMAPYALIGFAAGEQARMVVSPTVEGVANLALSLILARSMGATGVALGTLCGSFVGVGVHCWNSMPKTTSISFSRRELFAEAILKPIAWTIPSAGILFLLLSLATGTALRLAALASVSVVLCAVFWKTCVLPEEQAALARLGGRFFPISWLGGEV